MICAESFAVHHYEDRLFYVGRTCDGSGPQPIGAGGARFFLHVDPVDRNDRPAGRRQYDNLDFKFQDRGAVDVERCVAVVELPSYEIAGFRTGQYVPGEGRLWEGEYRFDEQ